MIGEDEVFSKTFQALCLFYTKDILNGCLFFMKTIFITSFHPLISRNILSTGMLDVLRKQALIILLVPHMKHQYFQERFGGNGIIVEGVDHRLTRRDLFSRQLFLAIADTKTLRIKKRSEFFLHKNPAVFLFSIIPGIFIGRSSLMISFMRAFDRLATNTSRLNALFERYQPDAVCATDVQNEIDVLCLREARRRGIRSIGMVRSWDNLSAKGIIRELPDTLAVNNEIIKREAMRWSFVPEEKIIVVGVPHYDRYVNPKIMARDEWLRVLGLDHSKKTILFAPIGERYMPGKSVDQEILNALSSLDVNIIVRLPPTDIARLKNPSSATARIIFDDAGVRSWKQGDTPASRKLSEIGNEDEEKLIQELFLSDIVVTGLSTMLVDGAVFDKPLVSVCFDRPEWSYWESFRRYHQYDHVRPIIESGGVQIANSPDELAELIRAYCADPTRDAEGRKRIRHEQAFLLDGQSSRRLMNAIISVLHG